MTSELVVLLEGLGDPLYGCQAVISCLTIAWYMYVVCEIFEGKGPSLVKISSVVGNTVETEIQTPRDHV